MILRVEQSLWTLRTGGGGRRTGGWNEGGKRKLAEGIRSTLLIWRNLVNDRRWFSGASAGISQISKLMAVPWRLQHPARKSTTVSRCTRDPRDSAGKKVLAIPSGAIHRRFTRLSPIPPLGGMISWKLILRGPKEAKPELLPRARWIDTDLGVRMGVEREHSARKTFFTWWWIDLRLKLIPIIIMTTSSSYKGRSVTCKFRFSRNFFESL